MITSPGNAQHTANCATNAKNCIILLGSVMEEERTLSWLQVQKKNRMKTPQCC